MNESANHGRTIFLIIAGTIIGLEWLIEGLTLATIGSIRPTTIFRQLTTLLLLWLIYRGHRWASLIMAFFLALTPLGVLATISLGLLPSADEFGIWSYLIVLIFGVVGIVFLAYAGVLVFSQSVKDFQEIQRTGKSQIIE